MLRKLDIPRGRAIFGAEQKKRSLWGGEWHIATYLTSICLSINISSRHTEQSVAYLPFAGVN